MVVTSSRRAGRVTNKTKLLVVRGSEKVDLGAAETIVWDEGSSSSEATKHQHVGAKGVESGELLEHHLQAALSSASLLHSRPSKPSSPTSSQHRQPSKSEPGTSNATLNYHIPTPDATGLIQNADYAKLYQTHRYNEPHGYIRFSDTVEESSAGLAGLGYCMDDADEKWLKTFNGKAEGGSGDGGANASPSPLKDRADYGNSMGPPLSAGRPSRGKGKEKEDKPQLPPTPIFISEGTFEFIMGILEKHAEDSAPMLHTDLSLLPKFASVEHFFSASIPASFLPSFEVPKGLPPPKELTRMARSVFPHWKERRTTRKGKTIIPILNYDETNDGDPYVCFRRRDIRATRKTRRTDNFSVEQMQKVQVEMRTAQAIAQMVLRRETEKLALVKVDREVWEAKWKLFETKKRWPSLGMTREEEELITGRQTRESVMAAAGTVNAAMLGGRDVLSAQRDNIPSIRKKLPEKEREERDKRERNAMEAARIVERGMGMGAGGRSNAPEILKERMMILRQKLEEELSRKKASDAEWDDATDSSYQPLPQSHAIHAFRPITALDPRSALAYSRDVDGDEGQLPSHPPSFRLRRGRGGIVRLDRKQGVMLHQRDKSQSDMPDWLFPDTVCSKGVKRRPQSIDAVETMDEDDQDGQAEEVAKRRRLSERCRYDADRGGGLGVGMGIAEDEDRVIIDDLDQKYMRHRIGLLNDSDIDKLRPDMSALAQAFQSLDAPVEMPPSPVFVRPQLVPPNPQLVAAQLQQQQMLQQQQIEQFQRYQILAQQQAMAAQQHAAVAQAAQAQAAQQQQQQQQQQQRVTSDGASGVGSPAVSGMQPPNGRPPVTKRPSSQNGVSSNGSMPPPSQPNQARPSLSPTNSIHQPMNGQSPQMVHGLVQQGSKGNFVPPSGNPNMDAAMQQRFLAARALAAQQVAQGHMMSNGNGAVHGEDSANGLQVPAEHLEIARLAQQAGFGNNLQAYLDARNKARLLTLARNAQQQQAAQVHAQQQQQQSQNGSSQANVTNGNGTPQPGYGSPSLSNGQLQLKLPPHAAARLGAATQQPASQRAS